MAGSRWFAWTVVGVVALTSAPYLFDWSLQGASPLYGWYSWFAFNATDGCVYLSWMRQYADGAWTHRNLFTTLPQSGHQLNLLFLVLGKLAALTALPLMAVYHLARLGSIYMVFWVLRRFLRSLGMQDTERRWALVLVAFSAGLGWVPGLWERDFAGPVDVWQPEAITFLSLYLFPLFGVGLALILAFLYCLLQAERNQSLRHAALAGLWGLLLANVHTYDILSAAAVWLAFLAACRILRLPDIPFDRAMLSRQVAAAVPTAVGLLHMAWVMRTESVFAKRVGVPTPSPAIWWVLLGYGLLIPLAAAGAILWRNRARAREETAPIGLVLLGVWAFVNVLVAYLPAPFQRKLLMGAHVPIAALAAVAVAALVPRLSFRIRLPVLVAGMLVLSLSNLRFIVRERGSLRYGAETVRAFLTEGEAEAAEWLRRNVPPEAIIQPLPWIAVDPSGRYGFVDTTLACYVPGLTGHAVHAGHWGETPDFGRTMGQWLRFLLPETPDTWRKELLRTTGVRYIVFSQKRPDTRDEAIASVLQNTPALMAPYLRRIENASNEDVDVFEVTLPREDGP